jgi:hypothetical protein
VLATASVRGDDVSAFACPHCGGEIVVLPGSTPFPGWRDPAQTGANPGANDGANPGANQIAQEIQGLDLPKTKSYNQGYDQDFLARFWKLYPLLRSKRKAQIAWRNAVSRLTQSGANRADAIAVIEAGARRYREDPNREAGFTKYAEGWLNGDGWEDEPLPTRLSTNGRRPPDPPRPMTSGEMDRLIEDELGKDVR